MLSGLRCRSCRVSSPGGNTRSQLSKYSRLVLVPWGTLDSSVGLGLGLLRGGTFNSECTLLLCTAATRGDFILGVLSN